MTETSGVSESRRRIRWNPEISLGHIIQAGCLLVAVTGAYFTLDKRISSLEVDNERQSNAATTVVRVETRLEMIEEQSAKDQKKLEDQLLRIEQKVDELGRQKN